MISACFQGLVLFFVACSFVLAEERSPERILNELERDPSTVLDPRTHVSKPEDRKKVEDPEPEEEPVPEAVPEAVVAVEPEPVPEPTIVVVPEPIPEAVVAREPEPVAVEPEPPPVLNSPVLIPEEPFTLQTFQEFVRKSPIPKEDLVLSKKTAEQIEFRGFGRGELSVLGSLSPEVKLYLDGHPLSTNKEFLFNAKLLLKKSEERHELLLEKNKEAKVYPFKIKFEKEPPLPLRVRFKTEEGELTLKELLFKGVFASEEYIRLIWLRPEEAIEPKEGQTKKVTWVQDEIDKENKRPPSDWERELSAEFESLQAPKSLTYRKPTGLSVEQGLGFFSVGAAESKSWQVSVKLQRNIRENMHWEVSGSTFVLPLSTSEESYSRLLKLEVGVGLTHPLSESFALSPGLGLRYQTLLGGDSLGYQDLLGARISMGQAYQIGEQKSLHALVSLALFNGEGSFISLSNREFGLKAYYQWGSASSWISSYYLGGEWTTLSLSLPGVALSSSLYSGFLGVLF